MRTANTFHRRRSILRSRRLRLRRRTRHEPIGLSNSSHSAAVSSLAIVPTQQNFENAFYRSPLMDNNSVEQWEAEGAKDMAQRANARWKAMLAEYEAPPLDAAADEAILDCMNRRRASFADSNV
jgi:Trimethylamine methyltransferase (MTTB)